MSAKVRGSGCETQTAVMENMERLLKEVGQGPWSLDDNWTMMKILVKLIARKRAQIKVIAPD